MNVSFSRFRATTLALILGVVIGSAAVGTAWAAVAQPHMQNALNALQTAQTELNAADANKGGHRTKAMALVAQAIQEVQLGIQFAQK